MMFFDYGNAFLLEASRAKADILNKDGSFKYPSYVQDIMGPICFDYGFGPFRWVCASGKLSDLKKVSHKNKNIFKNIKLFKNTKYLWGGKSFKGIDCSALVQVFLNYNNKFFPRDSRDQEKYLTKKIKLKNLRKNDIIFWKGHVAVALSDKKIIHAYGPMKKVVIMDTKKAIERIERTAKLKVTSIRRI